MEIIPVLQTIVGKTLEQSRMELIEEAEKDEFMEKRAAFMKKRNAEFLVTQRLEKAQERRDEEKKRR